MKEIIHALPYGPGFLFVDSIEHISVDEIVGSYRFQEDAPFFADHFPDHPVTPGVLLVECMAQIGLACLGIYLSGNVENETIKGAIAFTSSEAKFLQAVYPGQKVEVRAKKLYFRFGKLKVEAKMINEQGQLCCQATLAGMWIKQTNDKA